MPPTISQKNQFVNKPNNPKETFSVVEPIKKGHLQIQLWTLKHLK